MANYRGKLKHGLVIKDKTYLDFEMREATTADMFDAEDIATNATPLKYVGALIAKTLVRVGDFDAGSEFKGPFTLQMIRRLHPTDYGVLRDALGEAEKLGED